MSEVTVADLIGQAAEQSPEGFRQTFDQLMHDKVVAAIDARKQEVASNYFNAQSNEPELDTEDEDTDGQDAETDA
jgi:phosphoribosylformimino-5-aminoimidazole carboxamide ribonucleotide (ProFAR) isomerase